LTLNKPTETGELPYFYKANIAETGFRVIEAHDSHLFVGGGDRLLHYDISVASDPYLLQTQILQHALQAIAIQRDLLFVAHEAGVTIYRFSTLEKLEALYSIDKDTIGGVPHNIRVFNDKLWVINNEDHELVAIELTTGQFNVVQRIAIMDRAQNPLQAED